jgi:hypothetical protein
MSTPVNQQTDLRARLVALLRDSKKPLTFKGLARLVRTKESVVAAELEAALEASEVYRWPDYRASQNFWHVPVEQSAREVILTIAEKQALSKSALSKAAAKKLPGVSEKRVEAIVAELLAAKSLQNVSAFASSSKLVIKTGVSGAYFNAARAFVERKVQLAGFDPADFFGTEAPKTGTVDVAAQILEAVRVLEPVQGVPVSTLRLRNHLPQLTKGEFDLAALELRNREQVFLSLHADPNNISQEDKNTLIDGQDGTYYVAIAIR